MTGARLIIVSLLTTLLACAGIPIDRPVGIATKQLEEIKA